MKERAKTHFSDDYEVIDMGDDGNPVNRTRCNTTSVLLGGEIHLLTDTKASMYEVSSKFSLFNLL